MADITTRSVWCLRQRGEDSPRKWEVELSCTYRHHPATKVLRFKDPSKDKAEDDLLRWYFEDYSNDPFARTRALEAECLLERYRRSLLAQLGLLEYDGSETEDGRREDQEILLRIFLSPEQSGIDRINWEILEQPTPGFPRIRVQRELSLPSSGRYEHCETRQLTSGGASTFRILVLTARSHQKADVAPRLTSLPLVEALSCIPSTHVVVELARPATFAELRRRLTAEAPTGGFNLVHLDMHGYVDPGVGATLEFVDEALSHRKRHSAVEVAKLLSENHVRWAVLCACRTASSSGGDAGTSNLALTFLRHGIRGVLAMRYELQAVAAPLITKAFYRGLCIDGKSFIQAAIAAREALMQNRRRRAKYGESIEIQDYCVPATYCLLEEGSYPVSQITSESQLMVSAPVLIGRGNEVERLEVSLVKPNPTTFFILTGDVGIGKTQMIRHLAWWWRYSKMFDSVALIDAGSDDGSEETESRTTTGLTALVRRIACELKAEDAVHSTKTPSQNLVELGMQINTADGKRTVLLLDGIDELYHPGCQTPDTRAMWHEFLQAAHRLSQQAVILMAITATEFIVPEDLKSHIFILVAETLPSAAADLIQYYSSVPIAFLKPGVSDPDTDLKNALSALDWNSAAIQRHSQGFREPYCGLGRILDWSNQTSIVSQSSSVSPETLDRAERMVWCMMFHLSSQEGRSGMFGLLLLGLFTHVVPEVGSLGLLVAMVDEALSHPQDRQSTGFDEVSTGYDWRIGIPFDLWNLMSQNNESSAETEGVARGMSRGLDLLRAAGLARVEAGSIMDGKEYHVLHPRATKTLRDILALIMPPSVVSMMLEIFKEYQENRSQRMARLAKDISVRSGVREYAPLVVTERFTLLSVILHSLNDKLSPHPAAHSQIPLNTLYIVWPSSLSDDRLCPELLGTVILRWIRKEKDGEFSTRKAIWPQCQNILWLLNWAVDYTIRFKRPEDFSFVFPLREEFRETQAKSRLQQGVVNSPWPERKALLTNLGLAYKAGDSDRVSQVITIIQMDRILSSDAWGWMGPVFDANLAMMAAFPCGTSVPATPNITDLMQRMSLAQEDALSVATHPDQQWMISDTFRQGLAMTQPFMRPIETVDDYIMRFGAMALRDKFLGENLLPSLPPKYIGRGTRFIDSLGKGNLTQAKLTAEKALKAAVDDENRHVSSVWRSVCELLGSLESEEENRSHDGMRQVVLEHLRRKPGTELQQAVLAGDFDVAYNRVKAALVATEITAPQGKEARMMREATRILEKERAGKEKDTMGCWTVLFKLYQIKGADATGSSGEGTV